MNIARIFLSLVCVAVGLVTVVGYFLVIQPTGGAPLVDVILALSFAALFIVGGMLVLLKNHKGMYPLIAACVLYGVAGLYNPIVLYGHSALEYIHPQFYLSLTGRCILVAMVFLAIHKQGISEREKALNK